MINENLKSLRKINQYTQEELAEKLNVSRQSIAKWESGVSQTKG
ncbi:helix-turn-helix transcriptional regulator, partial [Clostridioides difficile]